MPSLPCYPKNECWQNIMNSMRKNYLLLSALYLLATLLTVQGADSLVDLSEPAQLRLQRPILIAHRGGVVTATAPECSLAAIKLAAKNGFSMVELDIQRSQDGVAIVFHDDTLKRACGLKGKIADYPAAKLSEILYSGTKQKVVNFNQALALCSELRLGVMLDLKSGLEDEAFLELINQDIIRHKLSKAVLSISSTPQARTSLKHVRFKPTAEQMTLFRRGEKVELKGTFWFGLPKALPTKDVSRLQAMGAYVFPAINTFRYPKKGDRELAGKDIERLRSAGVDGFQIDSVYADLLKAR